MEIREKAGAIFLPVRVVPRAKRSEIVGLEGGALKVRVAAPPLEERANRALVELLADSLGLKRWQMEIVSGSRGRKKMISIQGLSAKELERKLEPFIS